MPFPYAIYFGGRVSIIVYSVGFGCILRGLGEVVAAYFRKSPSLMSVQLSSAPHLALGGVTIRRRCRRMAVLLSPPLEIRAGHGGHGVFSDGVNPHSAFGT